MKTLLSLITIAVLLIGCSTEEVDDLSSVDELHGDYTLAVLVERKVTPLDNPDDHEPRVFSYPYSTGIMSLKIPNGTGTMSFHIDLTIPGEDPMVIDFEADVTITPYDHKPGKFTIDASYTLRHAVGRFRRHITWDGNILAMDHSATEQHSETGIYYELYWLKY